MKTWQLSILAAAAAFGLQACDVNVRSAAQDGAATSEVAQSSPAAQDTASANSPAPTDTAPLSGDASATSGTTPSGSTALPVDPALTADGARLPPLASPDTGAMGAPGAAPAMPAGADGAAAPTELARFLEENPVPARKGDTASTQGSDGKSSTSKADDRGNRAQGSNS
jgi:hypothetical protein